MTAAEPPMQIGFIGLGHMGRGMARNLMAKGHALQVIGNRDRSAIDALTAQGAVESPSPAVMAASCAVVHLCLPNSRVVEAVMRGPDGLLAGARPGLVVIDTTTADPASTEALSRDCAAAGVTLVDAPLGRTPAEAEAGTLDAMVGCDDATFARVRPVIACWAANITHVGPVGSGHRMKLIMNFISMGYAAMYAEALAVGARAGIAPQVIRQVIGTSRLSNGFFETFMRGAVGREANAHKFTIANASKDTRYLAAMAQEAGALNPIGAAVRNYFAQAEAAGLGAAFVPQLADQVALLNGLDLAAEIERGAAAGPGRAPA